MLLVSRSNVERGRNISLSLRNRAAGDAIDSGITFRIVFKTKEKKTWAFRNSKDRQRGGRTVRISEGFLGLPLRARTDM